MRYLNITGIILKKHNTGEQDQYVTIFSPTLGKIDARARGARKINSSFIGHLEILNICDFQLYKNQNHFTITQCQIRKSYKNIRETLNQSMLSFHLLEIFLKIAQSEENGDELFDLIAQTLEKIDQNQKNQLHIETFKIKMLDIAGALPNISRCGNCDIRWNQESMIHIDEEGHISCFDCSSGNQTLIPFNTMKLIHFIQQSPFDQIEKIAMNQQDKTILKKVMAIFLHNYISSELKTEKFIAHLHE
ncbi:DNA repair protein RecO [Candidatus Peregrinibacteria bacterium]|nr:DNA repair protein RecO [Candidatus Peregrinibacteria bacterium]